MEATELLPVPPATVYVPESVDTEQMNEHVPKRFMSPAQVARNSKRNQIENPMHENCPTRFDVFRNDQLFRFVDPVGFHVKVIVDDVSASSNNHGRENQEEKVKRFRVPAKTRTRFMHVRQKEHAHGVHGERNHQQVYRTYES